MGAYSYKYVRDQIPPYVTDEMHEYEGGCDYDGDMWVAASEYIEQLEAEIAKQYAITSVAHNERLIAWLKTREKTFYVAGPAITD